MREAHGSCGGKAAHPQKPGRPSHNYHTAFIGMLRIVVTLDVQPGRMHSGKVGAKGRRIWDCYALVTNDASIFPPCVKARILA